MPHETCGAQQKDHKTQRYLAKRREGVKRLCGDEVRSVLI